MEGVIFTSINATGSAASGITYKGASPKNGYPLSDIYPDNPFRMMSYIGMFVKDAHKTLHVTYRSYQQKKLNQTRHVSFLIGGTREKICAKNGSYQIYIRIRVSVFGRRTLGIKNKKKKARAK